MADDLTPTQSRVLDYIATHIVERQRPPSRKEISRNFGWSAVNAAEDLILALERKGHIALDGSGDGKQPARYPRVIRWPNSVLPVLRLATSEA